MKNEQQALSQEEKKMAIYQARVIRCARKAQGVTQVGLAKLLNLTQGTISKVESAELILRAHSWIFLCQQFSLDPHSIMYGTIDDLKPAQMTNLKKVGTFKLPKKYQTTQGVKMRWLFPIIQYLEEKVGVGEFPKFFRDTFDIDGDFVYCMDHQLNYQFVIDFFDYLGGPEKITKEVINDITKFVRLENAHGALGGKYAKLLGQPNSILQYYIKNFKKYTCDFELEIEEQNSKAMKLGLTANSHIIGLEIKLGPVYLELLRNYQRSYLEALANFGSNENYTQAKVTEENNLKVTMELVQSYVEKAYQPVSAS